MFSWGFKGASGLLTSLLRVHGVQYGQSAYTGAQRGEPLELMDNLTVHLSGAILLDYRVDKAP